jgi:hypothetical protein
VTVYDWPVDPSVYTVTQEFGDNPGKFNPNPPGGHTGRDFATPIGTPIRAPGDGVIEFAGDADWTPNDNPLWMMGSTCIILDCGDTEPSFTFGHLSRVGCSAGQRVARGQVIGWTGNSGITTGPHLHFEAMPPGYVLDQWTYGRVDPRRYCSGVWSGVSAQATSIDPIGGFLMALTDAEQQFVLEQVKYLSSPLFKVHIFSGQSPEERAARQGFIEEIVSHEFPWYGFDGKVPAEGRTTTSIKTDIGWADARATGTFQTLLATIKALAGQIQPAPDDEAGQKAYDKLVELIDGSVIALKLQKPSN